VSHHVSDHTSILRFIQHSHGLPALTARDANAWPLLDYFDFSEEHTAVDPSLPPAPPTPTDCGEPFAEGCE
jgi:phospholipase C